MSNVKANIKTHNVIDDATVIVGVSVSHGRVLPAMESVAAAIGASTQHSMTVIPGSIRVTEKGNFKTSLSAAMRPATEAVPFVEGTPGFVTVSSNVYMDESERMWTLENGTDGKVLVRSSITDDSDDIAALMQSCSSFNQSSNRDVGTMRSVSAAGTVTAAMLEPSDVIAFVRNGAMEMGAVISSESSETGTTFRAMSFSGDPQEGSFKLNPDQVVLNFGDANGEIKFQEDTTMTALSGNAKASDLVDYYRKLYGHNQEFLNKLLAQINSYAFC